MDTSWNFSKFQYYKIDGCKKGIERIYKKNNAFWIIDRENNIIEWEFEKRKVLNVYSSDTNKKAVFKSAMYGRYIFIYFEEEKMIKFFNIETHEFSDLITDDNCLKNLNSPVRYMYGIDNIGVVLCCANQMLLYNIEQHNWEKDILVIPNHELDVSYFLECGEILYEDEKKEFTLEKFISALE